MLKKTFKQMAIAQIVSAMTVILCLLIDSIMIGRFLGVDSMAAYGLSNPLLLSFAAIGSMVSAGVQVMCSKSLGSGDQKANDTYYSVTIMLCVAVSLFALLLVIPFRHPLCIFLGAGDSGILHDMTSDYLLGFIIGAPAFLASTILVPFMQLAGKQTRLVVAVVLMTISDITFDMLNVFVFHGGMLGMGIASSLSYYIAFFIGIFYFLDKKCLFHFKLALVKMKEILELLKAGIPTVINMISLVLLSFVLNQILMMISGSTAVAAYSIISTASNICYAFSSGIAAVVLMLSGIYYYEDDRNTLYELMKLMLRYDVIIDVILTTVILIIAPFMVMLFMSGDSSAYDMAVLGLRLFALSLVPSSVNTGLKHFFQGTGHIRLTEFISVLQNFACIAMFSFLLSFAAGTTGVWLGYLCGECLVLLIIYIIVWGHSKNAALTLENFSMLPKEFGLPEDCYLRATLRSEEEVVAFSQKTSEFCRQHNANARCCTFTALCIEEIGMNILSHGYKNTKKRDIDVSLFFKQPELVLRIRDEGKPFDPVEYMELAGSDDPARHIGIRMVFGIAKRVSYTNSMSQNSVTITMDSKW
jgi:putative MATE family efflux protein